MADVQHNTMSGTNLHQPGYVQSGDPGAVGAGIMWIDTSGGTGNWVTRVRNAGDTAWEVAGAGSDGSSGYSGHSGISGFSGATGSGGGGGGTSSNYVSTITNGDLASGKITIVHSLADTTPIVVLYDNLYNIILPDEVHVIDLNTIEVDLTSYGAIAGTWNIRVGGVSTTYALAITNGDLVAGVATITHNLGSPIPVVVVYNNSQYIIMPDNIQSTGALSVTVDLSSFGTLVGTWNIRVSV